MSEINIFITILIALCLSMVNIGTIIVITLDHHLRRLPSNYPIASFLFASAFQGMVAAPLYIYKKLATEGSIGGSWMCDSSRLTYFISGHVMKWSLLVVSIDRVFAIKYPYKYQKIVTKRAMIFILLVVWIVTLSLDMIPFAGDKSTWEDCHYVPSRTWGLCMILIYNVIPFFIMAVNYAIIWKISAKFAFFDQATNASLKKSLKKNEENELHAVETKKMNVKSKLSLALELKATKTSLILIAVYVVCWGPLGIFYMTDHFCYQCLSMRKSLSKTRMSIKLLCFTSSLFTPLIYCWANKGYRTAARRVLQKFNLIKRKSELNHSTRAGNSLLAK